MTIQRVLTTCSLCLLCLAWPLSGQTTQPDNRIVQAIRQIEDAPDVKTAAEGYTKGCGVDKDSVALNRAYFEKLLRLKEPATADFAVRKLLLSDKFNGLAWAIAGYNDARRNRLETALKEFIQAAPLREDDLAVQANLAQLAAWYQSEKKHNKIATDDEAKLDKLLQKYKDAEEFDREFNRVNGVYQKKVEHEAKLSEAKTKLDELSKVPRTVQSELHEIENRIKQLEALERLDRAAHPNRYPGGRSRIDPKLYDQRDDLRKELLQAQADRDKQAKVVADLVKAAPPPIVLPRLLRWQLPQIESAATKPAPPTTSSQPASSPAPSP